MTIFSHPERHHVAVFVRQGVVPIELGIVHQLFGQAAEGVEREPLYEVATCALRPGKVQTDDDFAVGVPHGPEALAEADTVIFLSSCEDRTQESPELSPRLSKVLSSIRPGARVASISTGAFILAAAGLLDEHTATAHWEYSDLYSRLFPQVALDLDALYTDSGNILTSAGSASGIDLCLHLIRRDHGAAVANGVARRAVLPAHREGGQAPYMRRPMREPAVAATSAARRWALQHLEDPISREQMAAQEGMPLRTFSRRFRAEVGAAPLDWLIQQRLDRARELLEESDLAVDQVAAQTGLGSPDNLRKHFHAAFGISPGTYRTTFRGSDGLRAPTVGG